MNKWKVTYSIPFTETTNIFNSKRFRSNKKGSTNTDNIEIICTINISEEFDTSSKQISNWYAKISINWKNDTGLKKLVV